MQVTNLLGMPRADLEAFFVAMGEKPYRARQLMKWVYHHYVSDFDAMTDMSATLRAHLKRDAEIRAPVLADQQISRDGTTKWRVETGAASAVEAVLIPEPGRNTLCVSSQYGCALNCSFCATGKQGFGGNLTAADIVGQVWGVNRLLLNAGASQGPKPQPITNVVFMGMGEPLHNFDAVTQAIDVLMDDLAFGLSKRRITVSTAGLVPRIDDLARVSDVSLAVSLHAPTDELRNQLVPINRKYPIADLMAACHRYLEGLGRKRLVTMEYTLIDGINDDLDEARALADLLRPIRCKINLIPFNPFPGTDYRRPSGNRIRAFQKSLLDAGLPAMLRTTRGDDVAAACGQLVGVVENRAHRARRDLIERRTVA